MNNWINLNCGSRTACRPYTLLIKGFILIAFILAGIQASVQAQESQFTRPSWWFGAAAGANFNFHRGSTQILNSALTAPVNFDNGFGAGLYLAPLVEFHRPDSKWGIMLQTGYDSRRAAFTNLNSFVREIAGFLSRAIRRH